MSKQSGYSPIQLPDSEFTSVLQSDTLVFIITLNYVSRTSISRLESRIRLHLTRSQRKEISWWNSRWLCRRSGTICRKLFCYMHL